MADIETPISSTGEAPAEPLVPGRGVLAEVLPTLGRLGLMTAVVLGSGLGWSTWRYGSPLGFLQALDGKVLIAERMVLYCGEARPGDEPVATFRLRNVTNQPVRVVGMRLSCGCGTTRECPFAVAPGETQLIPLTIHITDRTPAGELRVGNELLLDTPSAPVTLEATLLVRSRPQ